MLLHEAGRRFSLDERNKCAQAASSSEVKIAWQSVCAPGHSLPLADLTHSDTTLPHRRRCRRGTTSRTANGQERFSVARLAFPNIPDYTQQRPFSSHLIVCSSFSFPFSPRTAARWISGSLPRPSHLHTDAIRYVKRLHSSSAGPLVDLQLREPRAIVETFIQPPPALPPAAQQTSTRNVSAAVIPFLASQDCQAGFLFQPHYSYSYLASFCPIPREIRACQVDW